MYEKITKLVNHRYPDQPEFCQAVEEFVVDIDDVYESNPKYEEYSVIERMIEPDRILSFRVCWEDDQHNIHVNRGWRVQFNNALGPYKGGLRFHPTVSEDILKALGFEQCIKNSLTTLPIGGGKGGANFNPKGKSEREIMRFCQVFIEELQHHIGAHTDVPAGDIGVGEREIGYMFGHYLKLRNEFSSALTGKMPSFGGSCGRVEATGYGCIYFLEEVLEAHNRGGLQDKSILISGAGNVALHAAEKCIGEQAKVLTLSDSSGMVYFKQGMSAETLLSIKHWKLEARKSLSEWAEKNADKKFKFYKDKKVWRIPADIAMPCATQNEIDAKAAQELIDNKTQVIIEGANMPLTKDAIDLVLASQIIFVPAKAANAGGVAVSSFERTQNAQFVTWPLTTVEKKLRQLIADIHHRCTMSVDRVNGIYPYKKGANIAGFVRLAEAMVAYGIK